LQCGGSKRCRRGLKTAESILPRFTELTSATCSPRTQQILQECQFPSLSLLFFSFDGLESLRQKIPAYSNKKKITRLLHCKNGIAFSALLSCLPAQISQHS